MDSDWDSCLVTLEGHRSLVTTVAFSRDSRRLVSGSDDETVKLWDVTTGSSSKLAFVVRRDIVEMLPGSHVSVLPQRRIPRNVPKDDRFDFVYLRNFKGNQDRSIFF
jgi:WD40 repeat protein